MTKLNQDSLATLLLCSDLGLDSEMKKKYRPYTLSQWNKLAERILNSSIKKPSNLLNAKKEDLKDELLLKDDEINRIDYLLKRGGNIAIEIERLKSLGIYITTRAELNYPYRLKEILKKYSPPIIYYSGNLDIASKKSVSIVGSRDVDNDGAIFTREFASMCVKQGYTIVSGGAKGVDSIAEGTSIEENGYAISIVSNNLSKKIKEKGVRNAILDGRLLVMSTVNPNANFTVYAAMDRNKYIYGLSQFAVVVSSSDNKGGTWTGAVDNLKKKWVPLYVRNGEHIPMGNKKLIELGAKSIDSDKINDNDLSIKDFLESSIENKNNQDKVEQINLYDLYKESKDEVIAKVMEKDISESLDVYELVLPYIKMAIKEPKNQVELSGMLNVNKAQINSWLSRALEENEIRKLNNPIRYAVNDN